MPFIQHDTCEIDIAINPSKAVALPPKGHAPTSEDCNLGSMSVRIVGTSGVRVVRVPIGNGAHAVKIAPLRQFEATERNNSRV